MSAGFICISRRPGLCRSNDLYGRPPVKPIVSRWPSIPFSKASSPIDALETSGIVGDLERRSGLLYMLGHPCPPDARKTSALSPAHVSRPAMLTCPTLADAQSCEPCRLSNPGELPARDRTTVRNQPEDRPSACMGQLRCDPWDVPEGSSRLTAANKKGRGVIAPTFRSSSYPCQYIRGQSR